VSSIKDYAAARTRHEAKFAPEQFVEEGVASLVISDVGGARLVNHDPWYPTMK